MNADPLKALLLPLETGLIEWPEGRLLFLNGQRVEGLPPGMAIQQYFKPRAQGAAPDIPSDGAFGLVLLQGGKQHDETRYLIACALERLTPQGMIVCAAANDAGGKRLPADLEEAGLAPESLSKHKSRVAWAKGGGAKMPAWLAAGRMQKILDGSFVSQPGMFGWDKIDAGSALLVKTLPKLQGTGADFGCGYGYLSRHIIERNDVKLYALDADYRAVQACGLNVEGAESRWADLTRKQDDLPPLDFVVMNPPFHEGKKAETALGAAFIATAAASLKPGGALWMVANAHLPYETVLAKNFASVEKKAEENGFKVFYARK